VEVLTLDRTQSPGAAGCAQLGAAAISLVQQALNSEQPAQQQGAALVERLQANSFL